MPIKSVSVNDIIGKSMSLNYDVPYYFARNNSDADMQKYGKAGTLKKNQQIRVISFLAPKPGRTNFFWMFGGDNGEFIVVHEPDRFNFQDIRDQGGMTVGEHTAADAENNMSIFDKLERSLSNAFNFTTGTAKTLVSIGVTFLVVFLIIILFKKSK